MGGDGRKMTIERKTTIERKMTATARKRRKRAIRKRTRTRPESREKIGPKIQMMRAKRGRWKANRKIRPKRKKRS